MKLGFIWFVEHYVPWPVFDYRSWRRFTGGHWEQFRAPDGVPVGTFWLRIKHNEISGSRACEDWP